MSQDRHEVYVTIATFDDEYVKYIRCEKPRKRSFLKMQEFGPFSVLVKRHMEEFGHILLALSIEADSG